MISLILYDMRLKCYNSTQHHFSVIYFSLYWWVNCFHMTWAYNVYSSNIELCRTDKNQSLNVNLRNMFKQFNAHAQKTNVFMFSYLLWFQPISWSMLMAEVSVAWIDSIRSRNTNNPQKCNILKTTHNTLWWLFCYDAICFVTR